MLRLGRWDCLLMPAAAFWWTKLRRFLFNLKKTSIFLSWEQIHYLLTGYFWIGKQEKCTISTCLNNSKFISKHPFMTTNYKQGLQYQKYFTKNISYFRRRQVETPRLPVRRARSRPRFTRRPRESCWATPANLFVRTRCERRRTWRRRLSSSRMEHCHGAARRRPSGSETVFRVQYSDIQSNKYLQLVHSNIFQWITQKV